MMKKKKILLVLGCLSLGVGGISVARAVAIPAHAASASFTEVTSTAGITSGSSYLITANAGSTTGTEYFPVVNGATAAISTGGVSASAKTNVTLATNLLTFTANGSNYIIKDGANYLYTTTANNGLGTHTTAGTNEDWTLAYVTGKGFTLKYAATSRYLTLYQTSNWRSYTSVYDYGASQNGYLHIYTVTAGADVAPTGISLGTYSTTMASGTNQTITATMTPSTTTEKVVWSTSDSSVLYLIDGGTTSGVSTITVVPVGNGTATITAHASTTTTVTVTTSEITVSGISADIAPRTITATPFALGTSYSSGNKTINNVAYGYTDLMSPTTDSTYNNTTTYSKGTLQVKASTGVIWNLTKFSAKISKVLVSAVGTSLNLVVAGGTEIKANTVASTKTSDGKFFTYTFDTPVDYITIGLGSGVSYINCFTIELSGGVETVATLADYINGIQVDRSDNLGACIGASGNYVAAKSRFIAASDTVKSSFQSSTDAAIVQARTRYLFWASRYGDLTPYATTYGSAAKVSFAVDSDNSLAYILAGLVVVSAGAFFVFRKKKQA